MVNDHGMAGWLWGGRGRSRPYIGLLIAAMTLLFVSVVRAQGGDVYVTTQDTLVLRNGPGLSFDVVSVLTYDLTLPAIGRDIGGDWVQVRYTSPDGASQTGWLAARYLVWSGQLLDLPVDGPSDAPAVPFARLTGPRIGIGPSTTYYPEVGAFDRAIRGQITEARAVEVVGRFGGTANDNFWVQFELDGTTYWLPVYQNFRNRRYEVVFDGNYQYPFGRLNTAAVNTLGESRRTLSIMQGRWQALETGQATNCNNIPAPIVVSPALSNEADLAIIPQFEGPRSALASAAENINRAIDEFRAVCAGGAGTIVDPATVNRAISATNTADRQLTLAELLVFQIARYDPIISAGD